MADIELVIKIPEEIYIHSLSRYKYQGANDIGLSEFDKVGVAIKNSTPLPKRHGRLIDISEYENYFNTAITYDDGNHIHSVYTNMISTIIEAESEDKE